MARPILKLAVAALTVASVCFVPMLSNATESGAVTLKILDPVAQRYVPVSRHINKRLDTLAGKKIAIVNNTKPGADYLKPHVEKVLKEKYPDIEFKEFRVSYNMYPKKKDDLKKVSEWADAAIHMLGD